MRFCLALMFQNEADWLRLHLPVLMQANVDGLVAIDGGSTDDSAEVIRSFGGQVFVRKFEWDFGAQGNFLIKCCEEAGYDAMLRLDPDELMFPDHINQVRALLESPDVDLVILPRSNFAPDRGHWLPNHYPDPQQRAWKLNKGVHYSVAVHEVPHHPNLLVMYAAHLNIFHYGEINWRNIRNYRAQVYGALQRGEPVPPPPKELNSDGGHVFGPGIPYDKPQPLNPDVIGHRAPLPSRRNMHLSVNLTNDRNIEYGWTTLTIPAGQGAALDFGSGGVPILSEAAQNAGYNVTALDVQRIGTPKGVSRLVGDLLQDDFMEKFKLLQFDLILCCSTIEHVGLSGRYGVETDDPDGDLKAMMRLKSVLAPGGWLLLTLPVGIDAVHKPMHRVYGERLGKLIEGLDIVTEAYWTKHSGDWQPCAKEYALQTASICVSKTDWQGSLYNIGCLALRKPA